MIGFGFQHGSRRARLGGASPPSAAPGLAATAYPVVPTIHYHPHSQAATLDGSNRVTACPDLAGLAALSGISFAGATIGPVQMTDALGRKFWRFRGADALLVSNALNALSARAVACFMVARIHLGKNSVNLFSPRYSAYTDDATNTNYSGGSTVRTVVASNSAPWLYGAGIGAFTDVVNGYKAIPGAQLQVIGVASRTTANGGQRLYVNADAASVAQSGVTSTGCVGGVIGAVPAASNGLTLGSQAQSSAGGFFDLYEFTLWSASLTNAQADAIAAAMVANYAIPAIDGQLILTGDSITNAVPTALPTDPMSGGNIAMLMTDPGGLQVPASLRVINLGESGNQVSNLVAKRDAANTMFNALYPGGPDKNIVACQSGRNDVAETNGKLNSTQYYSALTALYNSGSTGYLQRGWKVVHVANIAGPDTAVTTNVIGAENTIQKRLEAIRLLVADPANHLPNPTFLADCLAGPGQTYDGRLSVLHLYDVTAGGDSKFKTSTDAQDNASGYYDVDQTHLRLAGQRLMLSGGDTPNFGYGAIV